MVFNIKIIMELSAKKTKVFYKEKISKFMNEESDSEIAMSNIVQFWFEECEVYRIKTNEIDNRVVEVSVTHYSNIYV